MLINELLEHITANGKKKAEHSQELLSNKHNKSINIIPLCRSCARASHGRPSSSGKTFFSDEHVAEKESPLNHEEKCYYSSP